MSVTAAKWIAGSQGEVAEFFRVSPQAVQLWRQQGMPGTPKAYDLAEIYQWLHSDGPRGRMSQREGGDELTDKAREQRAKADMAELKVDQAAGRLVDKQEVETMVFAIADGVRVIGEEFGRMTQPITGKDVQRKLNHFVSRIE